MTTVKTAEQIAALLRANHLALMAGRKTLIEYDLEARNLLAYAKSRGPEFLEGVALA